MTRNQGKHHSRRGNSILEFAVVMAFLVPLFAGMFTLGTSLVRAIQASNVCSDAVLLMVRSNTDPGSGLDLSLLQNQRMLIRGAAGLGMNTPGNTGNAQYNPNPTGSGVLILSKVILVGPTECAKGIVPAPASAPPWTSANCPNFGQYAFAYRIVIGNPARGTSVLGNPPTNDVQPDGTFTDNDIAGDTSNRAANLGAGGVVTLASGTFALFSEMYVDVSNLNLFSIWHAPIIYARNIS